MTSSISARITAALLLSAMHLPAIALPGPSPVGVVKQRDCFGQFQTYDQWMDYIWEKNNVLAYLAIRWKFPEKIFTLYKHALDCRSIVYRSDDHLVMGYVVTPKARPGASGKLPVIVYNRGGNGTFGAIGFSDLFNHVFPLAEKGYVVLASQYRGVPELPEGQRSPDEFGGRDVRDVVNIVRMVPQLPRADAQNVFMLGQSRGSIMTFRALLDSPVPIRAAAIYSGVFDLHDMLEFRPEFEGLYQALIPEYPKHPRAALDHRSVTRWPERLPPRTGILIFHGGNDERAPLSSARTFAAQLRKLGRTYRFEVLAGESHFLAERRQYVHQQTDAWFKRFQKPSTGAGVARGVGKSVE